MTHLTHPMTGAMKPSEQTASTAAPAPGKGNHGMRAPKVVVSSERPLHEAVRQFKRDLITMTLEATGGNRSEAARRLGIQRTYLHRLIRELEIQIPAPEGRRDRAAGRRDVS